MLFKHARANRGRCGCHSPLVERVERESHGTLVRATISRFKRRKRDALVNRFPDACKTRSHPFSGCDRQISVRKRSFASDVSVLKNSSEIFNCVIEYVELEAISDSMSRTYIGCVCVYFFRIAQHWTYRNSRIITISHTHSHTHTRIHRPLFRGRVFEFWYSRHVYQKNVYFRKKGDGSDGVMGGRGRGVDGRQVLPSGEPSSDQYICIYGRR